MFHVIICTDKPDHLQTRLDNREAHLAYLKESGVVVQAGPTLDADGQMAGSILVLDVPTRDAAEVWAAGDPYAKAGLFAQVRIEAWKRVIG